MENDFKPGPECEHHDWCDRYDFEKGEVVSQHLCNHPKSKCGVCDDDDCPIVKGSANQ